MKKRKLLIGIVVLLASCTQKNVMEETSYEANIEKVEENLKFEDLIESYRYIQLETTPGNRIGEIKNLVVNDKYIYVGGDDAVFCYTMEGKFNFAVKQKGHANNEYIRLSSMNVADGKLFLLDYVQGKVLVFDAEKGTYIEHYRLPYAAASVAGREGELLIDRKQLNNTLLPNNERLFTVATENLEKPLQTFVTDKNFNSTIVGTISPCNEGFLLTDYWNNEIIKVTHEKEFRYLKVVLDDDLKIDEEALSRAEEEGALITKYINGTDKIGGMTNIRECEGFIIGQLQSGMQTTLFAFDRKTTNTIAWKAKKDKVWMPNLVSIKTGYKDCFYGIQAAEDIALVKSIHNDLGEVPEEKSAREAYETYKNIKENDAPLVSVLKFKPIENENN